MTEDELLFAVVGGAMRLGWRVHHDRRSDKALQQGHAGFPDVVLIRAGRIVFYELKTERGGISDDQAAWAAEMPPVSWSVTYRVVRPSDLDAALEELR